MSLGPQPTSAMASYGLPSAFSTEQEIRSKTSRRAAPVAVEVNSEGVIQLDGIATRGFFMSGGPQTYERQVTITPNNSSAITLTANQLVDGVLLVTDGAAAAPFSVTLPNVLDVNAYVNSNLVSNGAAITIPVANTTSPRTMFRFTIYTNQQINFVFNATQPAGHAVGSSGFQTFNLVANGAGDATISTTFAPGGNRSGIVSQSNSLPRVAVDVYFIQTAGTGTDPEWLILSN